MKKENVTISFESEQLAALEFSLKRRTPAYRRSWRNCSNASTNLRCRSQCGSIWTAARARCPSPPSGKTGETAAAGGVSLYVDAAH